MTKLWLNYLEFIGAFVITLFFVIILKVNQIILLIYIIYYYIELLY